jgi:hypothetical protein
MQMDTNSDRHLFYLYFTQHTATCSQAAKVLNIPQKSCTRYKRYWEKRGGILVIDLVTCPITGRGGVQLLTAAHRIRVFGIDYR